MSSKSGLAENGMTLAQIGQKIVYAVRDHAGTDEDTERILSDDRLTDDIALLILGCGELTLKPHGSESVVSYCKSLSKGKKVVIGVTNGKATIAKAKETFPGWIDDNFVNYRTDIPGQPTKKTTVEVLELIKDGTFGQIYGGFGRSLDSLCVTQSQIIRFVKDHAKWLRTEEYGTFFLFKEKVDDKDEFFVAGVYRYSAGLLVYAHRLSYGRVWYAEYQRRMVVPQL